MKNVTKVLTVLFVLITVCGFIGCAETTGSSSTASGSGMFIQVYDEGNPITEEKLDTNVSGQEITYRDSLQGVYGISSWNGHIGHVTQSDFDTMIAEAAKGPYALEGIADWTVEDYINVLINVHFSAVKVNANTIKADLNDLLS